MLRQAYEKREYVPNFKIDWTFQRQVVRRGHSSFVGLFPSTKSPTTVQYESTLERDAVTLFEADPDVTAISGQPMRIAWFDGEKMRHHVPDFLLERNGNEEVVEVKSRVKLLDPAIAARTALMVRNFATLGRRYVVLTEDDIRAGSALADAKVMMNGIGRHPGEEDARTVLALLAISPEPLSIDTIVSALGRPPAFVNAVYALMISGLIERAEPEARLDRRALVKLRASNALIVEMSHAF